MKCKITLIMAAIIMLGCKSSHQNTSHDGASGATKIVNKLHYSQEKHLKNLHIALLGYKNG